MKKCIWVFMCLGALSELHAQVISEKEAVDQALKNYPSVQIANMRTQIQKELERTAFNPQQTQLTFEVPTDFGLAFEFHQQFDFPGVYSTRSKWLKSQTRNTAEAANITRHELTRDVRLSYLDVQVLEAFVRILSRQDSLWRDIEISTQRLFDGGQINRADVLYASKQAGLINNRLANTRIDAINALAGLSLYTGQNLTEVEALSVLPLTLLDTMGSFYFDQYLSESKQVAERKLAVSKAERMPGLIVGYLRTPDRDTEFRYRFNAGVTIPLWQGQYQGEVDAGKIALETRQAETALQRQQAQTRRRQLLQTLGQTSSALNWFERTAIPQTDDLVLTYRRLYEGGEVDYALALRNIADAVDMQTEYLETLKRYNQSVIELEFLSGQ